MSRIVPFKSRRSRRYHRDKDSAIDAAEETDGARLTGGDQPPSPAQTANDDDFQWIIGNKPDDFKTKEVMSAVRQRAMSSYLKNTKGQPSKLTQPMKGKQASDRPPTPELPRWTAISKLQEKHALSDDQEDNASTSSTISKSLESVFSVNSLETSTTTFHEDSAGGFSREQVQSATRVFVSIVQTDHVLEPLYGLARNDPRIGVKKLQNHMRSVLKVFADDLRIEAKDYLEFSASRLVRIRAGHAARCISRGYTRSSTKDPEDTSDDDTQAGSFDEREIHNDLSAFRSFLTQSEAFVKFRVATELFCSQPPSASASDDDVNEDFQSYTSNGTFGPYFIRLLKGAVLFTVINQVVSLGCMEPPSEVGRTRIKVECNTCGERFFDDILERREGSIARLKQRMERTLKATITVIPVGDGETSGNSRLHFPPVIHNIHRGTTKVFRWFKSLRYPGLPLNNEPCLGSDPHTSKSAIVNASKLFIMSCVHRNWEHRILLQDSVGHIKTDRDLFAFLKVQVRRRRHHVMRVMSCRTIKAIHFVKFKLRRGGMLEVRDHDPCCKQGCSCMPPPNNLDYSFEPAFDPSDWPVVAPKTLAHLLKDPDIAHEDQNEISSWIPKRKGEELVVAPGKQSVEGWGLYFEEGWEAHDIVVLVLVVFIASLVFLICWAALRSDVLAAAGVSGYMVGTLSLLIAMVVFRAQ